MPGPHRTAQSWTKYTYISPSDCWYKLSPDVLSVSHADWFNYLPQQPELQHGFRRATEAGSHMDSNNTVDRGCEGRDWHLARYTSSEWLLAVVAQIFLDLDASPLFMRLRDSVILPGVVLYWHEKIFRFDPTRILAIFWFFLNYGVLRFIEADSAWLYDLVSYMSLSSPIQLAQGHSRDLVQLVPNSLDG